MKNTRMHLMVIGVAAAFMAGGLISTAMGDHAPSAAKSKKARRGPRGPAGPQGPQGPQGSSGAPGSAVAFAHVDSSGNVIEAESKGITDAMVTHDASGAYCFRNLGFTPKNIQVMQHYSDTAFVVARQTALLNGDSADCTGTTEQATVVFYVTSDVGTSAKAASGFYVVFE